MRIAFFTPYPREGPSTRFRVYQYLPFLQASGIQCDVFPFLDSKMYKYIFLDYHKTKKIFYYLQGLVNRRKHLKQIEPYDVVYVQLSVSPIGMYFENFLLRKKKPVIFDFDDADFLKYDSAVNWWSALLKNPTKTIKLIQNSNLVIAGNAYLADFAKKYNQNVFIIPTSLDTERYKPNNGIKKDKIIVGWMGSSASSRYLPLLDDVFRQLLIKHDYIEIVIIGSKNYVAPDRRIILKPWSLKTEISDLQTIDIGVMPLTNDEYAKGKCGFKALQYMSTGAVPVVSPVGVNTEIVKDGINGFVANSSEEWVEKISLLIEKPELHQRLGNEARKTVEEKYSLKINNKVLYSILNRFSKN